MSCDITLGRALPCKDSVGGIKAVYFINRGDYTLADLTYDVTNTDVITAVAGTPSCYKYEVKDSSSLAESIVSSRENGTTLFEQVLTLGLVKRDLTTHKEVKLLAYGNPHVIIEDNAGNFVIAGLEYGTEVTGGDIVTGTQLADKSGYSLTLTGREKVPANFLDSDPATVGFTVVTA